LTSTENIMGGMIDVKSQSDDVYLNVQLSSYHPHTLYLFSASDLDSAKATA